MNSDTLIISALENVFGVFLLVLAYKIYKSNCHTLIKSKFFSVEVSENSPANTTPVEISLPQILTHDGSTE
jgi:hypothetical protein